MKHYLITWWTFFFECWCNGLLKCVPFTYQKKNWWQIHFKILNMVRSMIENYNSANTLNYFLTLNTYGPSIYFCLNVVLNFCNKVQYRVTVSKYQHSKTCIHNFKDLVSTLWLGINFSNRWTTISETIDNSRQNNTRQEKKRYLQCPLRNFHFVVTTMNIVNYK